MKKALSHVCEMVTILAKKGEQNDQKVNELSEIVSKFKTRHIN